MIRSKDIDSFGTAIRKDDRRNACFILFDFSKDAITK